MKKFLNYVSLIAILLAMFLTFSPLFLFILPDAFVLEYFMGGDPSAGGAYAMLYAFILFPLGMISFLFFGIVKFIEIFFFKKKEE